MRSRKWHAPNQKTAQVDRALAMMPPRQGVSGHANGFGGVIKAEHGAFAIAWGDLGYPGVVNWVKGCGKEHQGEAQGDERGESSTHADGGKGKGSAEGNDANEVVGAPAVDNHAAADAGDDGAKAASSVDDAGPARSAFQAAMELLDINGQDAAVGRRPMPIQTTGARSVCRSRGAPAFAKRVSAYWILGARWKFSLTKDGNIPANPRVYRR